MMGARAGRSIWLSEGLDIARVASTPKGGERCAGGLSDRFRRRPAVWVGSGGRSKGGDPDIGGEGREAQLSAGADLDGLNLNENR